MSNDPAAAEKTHAFEQLEVEWIEEEGTVWVGMTPHPRPCFNPDLLSELIGLKDRLDRDGLTPQQLATRPHFAVLTSNNDGVFNLGGDLDLFHQLIQSRDREALEDYATACIDAVFQATCGYGLPLTTVSLVQGTALGGGFEAALAANVVLSERGVQMGLPEILFNLFPGMGAYSFLSRRLGPKEAERVILSGKIWMSEELHELGLIDVLAEPGFGKSAVREFIADRQRRSPNSMMAMQRVRNAVNPVTYGELKEVAMIWVDAAFNLKPRDLKIMQRLVKSQNRAYEKQQAPLAELG
jgi:DSF synthase